MWGAANARWGGCVRDAARRARRAFFANEADQHNDSVFSAHVAQVSKEITLDHPSIQINAKFRSQAPWPLAQKGASKGTRQVSGAHWR